MIRPMVWSMVQFSGARVVMQAIWVCGMEIGFSAIPSASCPRSTTYAHI